MKSLLPRIIEVDGVTSRLCTGCKSYCCPTQFSTSTCSKDGIGYYCRACTRKNYKRSYIKTGGIGSRRAHIRDTYGITLEEFNVMLETQGGVCAICSQPETKKHKSGTIKSLSVDHCHTSGRVRGLLCADCNSAIGYLRENADAARRAAEYIERHK